MHINDQEIKKSQDISTKVRRTLYLCAALHQESTEVRRTFQEVCRTFTTSQEQLKRQSTNALNDRSTLHFSGSTPHFTQTASEINEVLNVNALIPEVRRTF